MNPTTAFLADCSIKSIVVVVTSIVAILLLRKASAATKHLVWVTAFAALIVVPFLQELIPGQLFRANPLSHPAVSAKIPPAVRAHPAASVHRDSQPETVVEETSFGESPYWPVDDNNFYAPHAVLPPAHPAIPTRIDLNLLVLVLWIGGFSSVVAYMAYGNISAFRMERMAQPIDLEIEAPLLRMLARRPVRILCGSVGMPDLPMTWGVARPVIMLPHAAQEWPAERLESVLLHEFAHIHRMDALTQMVTNLVCAFYWFNPAVWVCAKALRSSAEAAADDFVLTHGRRASSYAQDLVQIAAEVNRVHVLRPNPGVNIMNSKNIRLRVEAILDPGRRRRGASYMEAIAAAAAGLGLVAAIAPLRSAHAMNPATPPSPAGQLNSPLQANATESNHFESATSPSGVASEAAPSTIAEPSLLASEPSNSLLAAMPTVTNPTETRYWRIILPSEIGGVVIDVLSKTGVAYKLTVRFGQPQLNIAHQGAMRLSDVTWNTRMEKYDFKPLAGFSQNGIWFTPSRVPDPTYQARLAKRGIAVAEINANEANALVDPDNKVVDAGLRETYAERLVAASGQFQAQAPRFLKPGESYEAKIDGFTMKRGAAGTEAPSESKEQIQQKLNEIHVQQDQVAGEMAAATIRLKQIDAEIANGRPEANRDDAEQALAETREKNRSLAEEETKVAEQLKAATIKQTGISPEAYDAEIFSELTLDRNAAKVAADEADKKFDAGQISEVEKERLEWLENIRFRRMQRATMMSMRRGSSRPAGSGGMNFSATGSGKDIVVDLDVTEGDVLPILVHLFNAADVPFWIDPRVNGTVSLSLHGLSFQSALDNILRQISARVSVESGTYKVIPGNP
jgi:beta-lactamase regulating signal transducer with metallopeptidase domain